MATSKLLTQLPIVDKSNKSEIVKECITIQDEDSLREIIYRIGMQVVIGDAQPEVVVSALYEIIKNKQINVNLLCDVLAILDIESQVLEKSYRDNFVNFLQLSNNRIVSDWLLKERLEYSTIGEAAVINNAKQASTKFIKLKTKLYYKQQKFNLFREESEGYSKLLTELCAGGTFDHVYMLNTIKSLIGCFNLDPNRVLDVILEFFETRLYLVDCFIPLIKNFFDNSHTLNQILAFKFNFYNAEDRPLVPPGLYMVTAYVLSHSLIDINHIYPYLMPLDSKICEIYKSELENARQFPRKIAEILSIEGAKHEDINIYEDEKLKVIGENQKLGLILALLQIGDWSNASKMMHRLPEYFAVSYSEVSEALCKLLHYLIDPLYRKYSGLPSALVQRIQPYAHRCSRFEFAMKPVDDFDQFKQHIIPLVCTIGPYIFRDTLLITKLIRICKCVIHISGGESRYDVLGILNVTILPAFALIESNSALAEELWTLLRLYPYNERFLLYNIWKVEPTIPLLIKQKCFIMKRIKYIMKRISKDKDSIKQSGRLIGKLSHSNPTYLFEYILGQIQSYDNLISPVVDSLKYLSSVSYDVLLFCVIEVLSSPAKEQSKHEGTSISAWLISLANFCGAVVKKYPIELPGLLQFIANQLKIGKCLDLLILKEIVQKMTGIETTEEMTDDQLEALSGGELLKSEGGTFNQVRNIKKSTLRLKDALLENNLAMALCILMSQQRNRILFQSENTHLKLIGKLYDQCQETLVQYGNFLSYSLTIDDYKRRLPPLKQLLVDYNLSPDVTFFLSRPMIHHDINSKFDELFASRGDKSKSVMHDCYTKASDFVLKQLVDSIASELSSRYSIELNARFFINFWMLTMYDLQVPEKSYHRERAKINQQIQLLEENKDIAPSKKRKERERYLNIIAKLFNEASQQSDHTERVLKRLDLEKHYWFEPSINKMDVTTNFLQHCLFPRCKFTATDALYCAKFVHLLHILKTPNFSTLICFDRIFGDISYTMSSCTENEANHYGRFLCAILKISMSWHKDIKVFELECSKFPGFVTKFCEKDPVHIDYESYRHVCHKWHYRLTKAFILCLDSGDYIQIRNSLIVLTKLLPHFPVMISFAQAIERRLDNIRNEEKEKRPDLFVLATGYSGQLKMKKGSFIPESEFHEKESKKTPATAQQQQQQQQQSQQQQSSSTQHTSQSSSTLSSSSHLSNGSGGGGVSNTDNTGSGGGGGDRKSEQSTGGDMRRMESEHMDRVPPPQSSSSSSTGGGGGSSSSSSKQSSSHKSSSKSGGSGGSSHLQVIDSPEGSGGSSSSSTVGQQRSQKKGNDHGSSRGSSKGGKSSSQLDATGGSSGNFTNKEVVATLRSESRSSSVSTSPRRSEIQRGIVSNGGGGGSGGGNNNDNDEKEYKKRKVESKMMMMSEIDGSGISSGSGDTGGKPMQMSSSRSSRDTSDRRGGGGGGGDDMSQSSSRSTHDSKKSSLRKRQNTKDLNQESPDTKRKKTQDDGISSSSKRNDDGSSGGNVRSESRSTRSTNTSDGGGGREKRSSSRRYKIEDDGRQ